jgi:hypothetical protein
MKKTKTREWNSSKGKDDEERKRVVIFRHRKQVQPKICYNWNMKPWINDNQRCAISKQSKLKKRSWM